MTLVKRFFAFIRSHRKTASKYLAVLSSLGSASAFRIALFIIVARILGPQNLGYFAALYAPIAVAIEGVDIGAGHRFIRGVARDKSKHASLWAHSLWSVLITAPVILGLYLAYIGIAFGIGDLLILALIIGVSELFFGKISFLAENIAIGHSDHRGANLARIIPLILRLAVYGVGFQFPIIRTLAGFVVMNALLSVVIGTGQAIWVSRRYGRPRGPILMPELRGGSLFAINHVIRAAQVNIDRMALSFTASLETLAFYSTSSHLLRTALMPVLAMLQLSYPAFFKHGERGLSESYVLSRRMFLPTFFIAFGGAGILFLAAGVVPIVLGPDFAPVVIFVRAMAWVVVPMGLAYIAADAFTGADKQLTRVILFAGAVAFQALVLFILVPRMGPWGAVIALYASATTYSLSLWILLIWQVRKARGMKKN